MRNTLEVSNTGAGAQTLKSHPKPESNRRTSLHAGLGGMHVFVFNREDDFPEIRGFVAAMDARYGLAVEDCAGDFKGAHRNAGAHWG